MGASGIPIGALLCQGENIVNKVIGFTFPGASISVNARGIATIALPGSSSAVVFTPSTPGGPASNISTTRTGANQVSPLYRGITSLGVGEGEIQSDYASVLGGEANFIGITSDGSVIGGGRRNIINNQCVACFVVGQDNSVSNLSAASSVFGIDNVVTNSEFAFVHGQECESVGGRYNRVHGYRAVSHVAGNEIHGLYQQSVSGNAQFFKTILFGRSDVSGGSCLAVGESSFTPLPESLSLMRVTFLMTYEPEGDFSNYRRISYEVLVVSTGGVVTLLDQTMTGESFAGDGASFMASISPEGELIDFSVSNTLNLAPVRASVFIELLEHKEFS